MSGKYAKKLVLPAGTPAEAETPKGTGKTDPVPTEAQLHAEMLHHLTIIRQFADEGQVKFCLAQEAFNEAERLAAQNLVVRPSATAAAALLGANGQPANKEVAGRIARGADPKQAERIKAAADTYDVQAKACLRGIFEHVRRLGQTVGLKVTIEDVEGG